jgi:putative phosphoribosyl transferase
MAGDLTGGFRDRREAGERLADALESLGEQDVVVLAIPRGGVEIGAIVAERLGAELDVVIPRKIGAPANPELGLGALAGDAVVLDDRLIDQLGVSRKYLESEIQAQREEIRRRESVYRGHRPPATVLGTTAVVVDDGVATGGTAIASLRLARSMGAARVILAVPVGPLQAIPRLREEADEVHVLLTPRFFYAVGQWYQDFPQVSDQRVIELLGERWTSE